MSETRAADRDGGISAGDIVGHVAKWQTYKNILYVLLAFPLGFAYGMFVTFGFVFGTVFLIVGVGFVVLLATVGGIRLIARFERWLANALLDVTLQPPTDRRASDGLWATITAYIDAPSTWYSVGFVSIKFWFGIIGILLLVGLANTIELLTAPLRYPTGIEFGTVNDEPIVWTISTLPEAMAAVPIGLVVGIALLGVSNGFAYVAGRIAIALLDGTDRSASSLDSNDTGGSRGTATGPDTDGDDRSPEAATGSNNEGDDRVAATATDRDYRRGS